MLAFVGPTLGACPTPVLHPANNAQVPKHVSCDSDARCRCLLGLVDDKESFRTLLSAPSVCVGWTRSCPGASLSESHANKVLTLAPREQSLNVSLSFHHHGNRCERAVTLPIAAPVVGLG